MAPNGNGMESGGMKGRTFVTSGTRISMTCLERRRSTSRADHTEQTSWLLFLKYLEWIEQDRA